MNVKVLAAKGDHKASDNQSFKAWRRLIFVFVSFWLAACSAPVSIVKPIDVSQVNQIATAGFVVKKIADYRFSLLFVKRDTLAEINNQIEVWGDSHHQGVAIPLHLRVVRDGVTFFDESLITTGVNWGQTFDYQGQTITTAVRLIKTLELVPGTYSVEVNTFKEVQDFRNIESFVEFSYYNPKH